MLKIVGRERSCESEGILNMVRAAEIAEARYLL